MNKHVTPKLTRRGFVIGTAAAGAGLAIGLDIPFGGPTVVRAADGSPEQVLTPGNLYDIFEITASVVKRPDGFGSFIVPTG